MQRYQRAEQQPTHNRSRQRTEHGIRQQWNHSQNRSQRSHHHGTETTLRTVYQCRHRFYSLINLLSDLIHQDNTVLNNHTDQPQCTDDSHKVECLPGKQHYSNNTDKYQRNSTEDDNRFPVIFEQHD